MSNSNRFRPKGDLDVAIEHAVWTSQRQGKGYFLLRAMANGPNRLAVKRTVYLPNKDSQFSKKLRGVLPDWMKFEWHIFYSVNAFREDQAIKENVVPGLLAHVDADGVALPPPGPSPTRIVRTSPGNHQFLYELNQFPKPEELEAISRSLTVLVGGDIGGHQSAKLLRLPGTINWKPEYDPKPLVIVVTHGQD